MIVYTVSLQILHTHLDVAIEEVKHVWGAALGEMRICQPEKYINGKEKGQLMPCQWVHLVAPTTQEYINQVRKIAGIQCINW